MHVAQQYRCHRKLVVRAVGIYRRWHSRNVGKSRTGIAYGEIVDNRVCLFQSKIARLVAVEISLDIYLILPQHLIAAYDAEKQAGACRRSAEGPHIGRIRVDGYQIGRKGSKGYGAAPVVVGTHAHSAADTHGQL